MSRLAAFQSVNPELGRPTTPGLSDAVNVGTPEGIANLALAAQQSANQANLSRYAQVGGLHQDRIAAGQQQFQQSTGRGQQQIAAQQAAQQQALVDDMKRRGLSPSVMPSMMQGVNKDADFLQRGLVADMSRRAGESGLRSYQDLLNFMENRTDAYPAAGPLMNLAFQMQQQKEVAAGNESVASFMRDYQDYVRNQQHAFTSGSGSGARTVTIR